jgi:transposase-like protein
MPHILEKALPKSTIYTDEYKTYNTLGKQGFQHRRIRHSEKIYVSGDVHTAFFRFLKKSPRLGIGIFSPFDVR